MINSKKAIFLIFCIGLIVYANIFTNGFVWDDELLILTNPYIKDLRNIPGLFTKNITYATPIESNLYRPLQMLTYALNYAGWKLDVRAYHLTNISIHILVALMLYWLTQLLSQNEILSLIVALFFITHPIHTEAVSFISGRADPLAALFILLTLIFFIHYLAHPQKASFYSLSLVSYLLALLSKEITLVIPLVLLAYDYIYKEGERVSFRLHLPFCLFGLTYIVLRTTILNFPTPKTVVDQFTFIQRLPVIFQSLTMYFKKLILPINLHMEYEPVIPPIGDINVILGIVIALGLVWTALALRKKEKVVSFGLAWFLLNYLPISNIYPLNAFFAEHWIYTPSFGLFILAGWALVKIGEKGQFFKWLISCMAVFLVVVNLCLTLKQNQYWQNPENFYQRTLQYNPKSARVHFRLGLLYLRRGIFDRGIEETKQSLQINPDYLPAYENLTFGYLMKGNYDKVIEGCVVGLKLNPNSQSLHNNLGVAYSAKGRHHQAIAELKLAISLNPNNPDVYNNLGSAYANMGNQREAISAFEKAIELNPNYAMAHQNLARAYFEQGQYDLAITHCQKAIQLGLAVDAEFLEQLKPWW